MSVILGLFLMSVWIVCGIVKFFAYMVRSAVGNYQRSHTAAVVIDARTERQRQADLLRAQKQAEQRRKQQARVYQAQAELERVQAEFDEQRELNEIIQERYELIAEEKHKADAMLVQNPVLLNKYEKVLRQRIASQNKMRSLQRKIEQLTDIVNA